MADVTQVVVASVHDCPVRKLAGMLNNGPPLFHSMSVSTLTICCISCKLMGHGARFAKLVP